VLFRSLIHVSEMSWTKKVKNPKSLLHAGQEVEVVITEVDVDKRRLSLSLRQAEPNPWEDFAARTRVGSRVHGVVRNLTDFGAFVELEPGVDGLVHVSDMAWTRRVSHPSEVVQKGQEVEAVIIGMDIPNQRISLSIKELLPNEWDEFANVHQVGDEIEGFITNVTDFGLFVELAPGVEGLCHVSEVERRGTQPLSEAFTRGYRVRTRLIRIDWNEKRIGLSLRGIPQPEQVEGDIPPEQTAEEIAVESIPEQMVVSETEESTAAPAEEAAAEEVKAPEAQEAAAEEVKAPETQEAATEEVKAPEAEVAVAKKVKARKGAGAATKKVKASAAEGAVIEEAVAEVAVAEEAAAEEVATVEEHASSDEKEKS
jgi:small subunit ribosomal protein S1